MSEPDVSDLLTVGQAIDILDSVEVRQASVRVPLSQAQGLCLAQDVLADRDYPPFEKSLMDGYAVRSADVQSVPAELRLVGEIAAGRESSLALEAGQTMAIMTGAPIPLGADAVIPIEDTSREQDRVRILGAAAPQRFIARQGSDIRRGEPVLRAGARLEAPQLAVAATIGAYELHVHPRPRVAVLATGDELIPMDAAPAGSQIRNSNTPMLLALLRRWGCDVTDLGIARDDPKTIRAAIDTGLQHDALFISGGMSMGAHDHVPPLLREMDVELKITKLRIKPGKPFLFGIKRGTGALFSYVFGLPGNPVSGFVCTVRLASRLLARLAGGEPEERWISARLSVPLPANGPREFYQPAHLHWSVDGPTLTPLGWKGSADLFTLAQANALLLRPENQPALPQGASVQALEI
jgi:molybdopterin molybdotransferase